MFVEIGGAKFYFIALYDPRLGVVFDWATRIGCTGKKSSNFCANDFGAIRIN